MLRSPQPFNSKSFSHKILPKCLFLIPMMYLTNDQETTLFRWTLPFDLPFTIYMWKEFGHDHPCQRPYVYIVRTTGITDTRDVAHLLHRTAHIFKHESDSKQVKLLATLQHININLLDFSHCCFFAICNAVYRKHHHKKKQKSWKDQQKYMSMWDLQTFGKEQMYSKCNHNSEVSHSCRTYSP